MSLGLYISVPFCRTKCSYCNFASDVFSKSAYENYVARLLEDIANVRQCASETCSWLFLDKTKNHRRRWCDMKSCGNRAKARRYYQRQKAG